MQIQGNKRLANTKYKWFKPTEQATTRTLMSVGLFCRTLKITKAGPGAILSERELSGLLLCSSYHHDLNLKVNMAAHIFKSSN